MANQESTAVTIPDNFVDHVKDACCEIEQLIRLLGTMNINDDSDLAVKGIAIRLHKLHSLVFGAILGSFDAEDAEKTVRGPVQWFNYP